MDIIIDQTFFTVKTEKKGRVSLKHTPLPNAGLPSSKDEKPRGYTIKKKPCGAMRVIIKNPPGRTKQTNN